MATHETTQAELDSQIATVCGDGDTWTFHDGRSMAWLDRALATCAALRLVAVDAVPPSLGALAVPRHIHVHELVHRGHHLGRNLGHVVEQERVHPLAALVRPPAERARFGNTRRMHS